MPLRTDFLPVSCKINDTWVISLCFLADENLRVQTHLILPVGLNLWNCLAISFCRCRNQGLQGKRTLFISDIVIPRIQGSKCFCWTSEQRLELPRTLVIPKNSHPHYSGKGIEKILNLFLPSKLFINRWNKTFPCQQGSCTTVVLFLNRH